ncbi:hypothetical protein [Bradyrhizobium sp. 1]|uniref:hypothetical protein n=1 Tax=Bradyrhizobium sp. 1 TaxID=241591 RepID=UPI001FF7E971|nr:hypothetical protein [Bradyrhizobium sp. 1]MCK1394586.1 hypothetical protein [Bradyrhizobium sp. 1]
MKWIRERDALIAQTMAFVQSVTGKKDGFHPPETSATASAVTTETVTVQEIVTVQIIEAEPPLALRPPEPKVEASPRPIQSPPTQVPPVQIPPPRMGGDVRSEIQARIANFRKHQERFEREREEYCAATLTKLRAAIRDPSLRPSAED